MLLRLKDRIGSGAYADVFSPDGQRAYKLFRQITDDEIAHAQPFIFRAETWAYELIAEHSEAARYTPKYFGAVKIETVLSDAGSDITPAYWPELCYSMERIESDPRERKFGSFYETRSWPRFEMIERLFEKAGVRHLGDASVLHWRRKYPKVIDFAVTDAAAEHWRPSRRAT